MGNLTKEQIDYAAGLLMKQAKCERCGKNAEVYEMGERIASVCRKCSEATE